jgi:hypothetical protein
MKISIRERICNSRKALMIYRPHSRSDTLGQAYETPSGLWVVLLGGHPIDAARDETHARQIINNHFATRAL